MNLPGSHQCVCPHGYGGDPYNGLCSPAQKRCTSDNECKANEKCVQPGECVCPPPFYTDPLDGNLCKSKFLRRKKKTQNCCQKNKIEFQRYSNPILTSDYFNIISNIFSDPCDRFPCGINAKCTPSDPPRCMCEAGYEGDPQHGCVDVNECANNPCGHGAYCINTKGDHICECPKGTVGDPYGGGCTGAVAKNECTSNDDCDNLFACVNGRCVNPCDNIPCGPNAYCEPDKHAAWCRCVIGFVEGKNNECVSRKSYTILKRPFFFYSLNISSFNPKIVKIILYIYI